jgi:elongator complex protein 3
MDYGASAGLEIFLSFEDKEGTLYGMLRLRLQEESPARLGTSGRIALVRELHVYGPEVSLGQRLEAAAQHRGLGRALLEKAESIAADEFGAPLIAVLSGVGAREYYRGYELRAGYMVKKIAIAKPSAERNALASNTKTGVS